MATSGSMAPTKKTKGKKKGPAKAPLTGQPIPTPLKDQDQPNHPNPSPEAKGPDMVAAPGVKPDPKAEEEQSQEKFTKLRALPHFGMIEKMLRDGDSCESVARYIRQSGFYTDTQESSLVRQLYRFREEFIRDRAIPQPTLVHTKTATGTHKVNILKELTVLYELQMTRVVKALEWEDKTLMPSKLAGAEMDRAATLLMQIRQVKTEMGLLDKAGERDSDGNAVGMLGDQVAAGLMGLLSHKFGPDAAQRLQTIGKTIQEKMRALPAASLTTPAPGGVVVNTKPPDGGG